MGAITKRVARLSDERELIYFDDADSTCPRAGPPTRGSWNRASRRYVSDT